MSKILDVFETISKINRCSGNYEGFLAFIKEYAKDKGYECQVDATNNILCKKKGSKPKLALQAHYDIVCLVDNHVPKLIKEGNILRADNSTLGADDGMGCAYILILMELGYDLEYVFTSDEEIGLIGANNIDFELSAKYMLNIDSESEDEICVGCAGGLDITACSDDKKIIQNLRNYNIYEIEIDNLPGGHSGLDIDKNVPNAIKLVIQAVKESKAQLVDINGGERTNSIAKHCKAMVAAKTMPKAIHENMTVKLLDDVNSEHYLKYSKNIVNFLYSFSHGVRAYNHDLDGVQTSINLAKVSSDASKGIVVELSARSMSDYDLALLADETKTMFKGFGFKKVQFCSGHKAWSPDINEFTNAIEKVAKKYIPNIKLKTIHAGLECAVFKDKFPQLHLASVGPNIYFPHSSKEYTELDSVEKVFNIVKDLSDIYTK